MALPEFRYGTALGLSQRLRPACPWDTVDCGDRLERREPQQRRAAGAQEAIELQDQAIVTSPLFKRLEAQPEHCLLQPPDTGVIDNRLPRKVQ